MMGCTGEDLDLRTSDLLATCTVVGKMLLVVSLVMNDDLGVSEQQDDRVGDADEVCD